MRPRVPYVPSLFSPPTKILSSTASLDRAAFSKTINLAAASVSNPKLIAQWRKKLEKGKEILTEARISAVQAVPPVELPRVLQQLKETHDKAQGVLEESERKDWKEPKPESIRCLILEPGVTASDEATFGPVLKQGLSSGEILGVFRYNLKLEYDHWNWNEIVTAILPEELHSEIPHGFNSVGHVAHLNLREQHLPYRHIIGHILLDKSQPAIRTVINKTDEVGETSEFRTFNYELLAGEDNLDVEVKKMGCVFRFNYGKVYWNSKLDQEHRRLVQSFQKGDMVVDVMAGVGPFAVPAAKSGTLVWANDYNPESVKYMRDASRDNKVVRTIRTFNQDGRNFIPFSVKEILRAHNEERFVMISGKKGYKGKSLEPDEFIPIRATVSHFVMNLPASAPEFLPAFSGIYHGHEDLFFCKEGRAINEEDMGEKMLKITDLPLVHVYCFATKQQHATVSLGDPDLPYREIEKRVSEQLGYKMRVVSKDGKAQNLRDGEMSVWDVRDVAPSKSMFCASFRVPREVAFTNPNQKQ